MKVCQDPLWLLKSGSDAQTTASCIRNHAFTRLSTSEYFIMYSTADITFPHLFTNKTSLESHPTRVSSLLDVNIEIVPNNVSNMSYKDTRSPLYSPVYSKQPQTIASSPLYHVAQYPTPLPLTTSNNANMVSPPYFPPAVKQHLTPSTSSAKRRRSSASTGAEHLFAGKRRCNSRNSPSSGASAATAHNVGDANDRLAASYLKSSPTTAMTAGPSLSAGHVVMKPTRRLGEDGEIQKPGATTVWRPTQAASSTLSLLKHCDVASQPIPIRSSSKNVPESYRVRNSIPAQVVYGKTKLLSGQCLGGSQNAPLNSKFPHVGWPFKDDAVESELKKDASEPIPDPEPCCKDAKNGKPCDYLHAFGKALEIIPRACEDGCDCCSVLIDEEEDLGEPLDFMRNQHGRDIELNNTMWQLRFMQEEYRSVLEDLEERTQTSKVQKRRMKIASRLGETMMTKEMMKGKAEEARELWNEIDDHQPFNVMHDRCVSVKEMKRLLGDKIVDKSANGTALG